MKSEESIDHESRSTLRRSGGERSDANEIDLFAISRVFWRHKVLIILTTVLLSAIAVGSVQVLTPLYSATAQVMIDPGQPKIADAVSAVLAGSSADALQVESEARALQSRDLAERLAQELRLDQDAEFNPLLQPPGPVDRFLEPAIDMITGIWSAVKQQIEGLFGSPAVVVDKDVRDPDQVLLNRVVGTLLSKLEVSTDGRSRVIGVTVTSEKPETAAKVVNALTDLYITSKLERKFEATRGASEWLNSSLAELRQRVEAAEDAVEDYRAEHGLLASEDATISTSTRETTDLMSQLALARSQRADAEARLREAQSASGGASAVAVVLESGLIQSLRLREAEVAQRISDLSQRVGRNHPDFIGAQAELGEIQTKIRTEVQKAIAGLKNELTAATARETALVERIDELKTEASKQNQVQVRMRALEREAAAARTLLETFLSRAQETTSQETYQQPDAHIVSRASIPGAPSFPKKTLLIGAGFLASLAFATLLAFLLEALDSGFRSEEQAEEILGVASLGLVPSLKRFRGKSSRPSTYIIQHPTSVYAESIRNLYLGLRLSNGDHLPRVVLFASSLPREGKTAVATSFASFLSVAGVKTIVVDTDLRKPSVHRALGMKIGPGLVDCLHLQVPLTTAIQRDQATGVDAITAGSASARLPHLLGTDQMTHLLTQLKATYDVVILDSAPLLAVADSRILGQFADKTVFLVRWADTRRETAKRGLDLAHEAFPSLAGTMLTMVDFDKYAKYRFGEFGHYYHQVEKYYGT
jgi:capsular exopolysaccharide synthesis family protein